ncbi:MAG: diacylglycerol kinase family lipid kinase [bacterium]|nr:diacylglycerol kinase family lipid kinase [bacterium]
MSQTKTPDKSIPNKCKLIYNPNAGKKRKTFAGEKGVALEEIKDLLVQYQIDVDLFPTKKAGHATKLAKDAIEEGYSTVLVAGGDGTVGEVANGLIGTDITLGILPLGTFMNVARMLSIPNDLEKAVLIIKNGRSRKIDVGCISHMSGKKLADSHYFLESAGIGIEAEFHQHFLEFENGSYSAIVSLVKKFIDNFRDKITLTLDDEEIKTFASLITISNGPYTGAALKVAPNAKLNDHRLTVSIFKMGHREIINYFMKLARVGAAESRKVVTHQAKTVKIASKNKLLMHADGRVFGTTPVEFSVIPNALSVITGFPKPEESALVKRTILDP